MRSMAAGLLPVGMGVGPVVSMMVVPKSNLRPCYQPLVFTLHPSLSHNNSTNRSLRRCNANSLSSEAEGDVFSVITSSNRSQVDYLGQSTKGDLNLNSGMNYQSNTTLIPHQSPLQSKYFSLSPFEIKDMRLIVCFDGWKMGKEVVKNLGALF